MRKALIATVSVLALSAGGALAGNESHIDQSGNGQNAGVNQASGMDNYSNILQSGTAGSTTAVEQAGTLGWSDVHQTGAASNSATVTQTTESNRARAEVSQTNAVTGAAQNVVNIQQVSVAPAGLIGTLAKATQSGGGGNQTTIEQGLDKNMTAGSSTVTQTGEFNRAITRQSSNFTGATPPPASVDNQSMVAQTGRYHYALIEQARGGGGDDDNQSTVTQTGSWSWATVQQAGDGNVSTIEQTGDFVGTLPGNTRNRFGHSVRVNQSGNLADSLVIQTGFDQTADVVQSGNGATSVVDQSGASNIADVNQNAGKNSSVIQTGTSGQAIVDQNRNGTASSTIEQSSTGDYARVLQYGTSTSIVEQSGGSGSVEVRQGGVANTMNPLFGPQLTSALSTVRQTGFDATATVTQLADGTASLIEQGGTGNTGTVMQTTFGAGSVITQTGTGGIATVTQ